MLVQRVSDSRPWILFSFFFIRLCICLKISAFNSERFDDFAKFFNKLQQGSDGGLHFDSNHFGIGAGLLMPYFQGSQTRPPKIAWSRSIWRTLWPKFWVTVRQFQRFPPPAPGSFAISGGRVQGRTDSPRHDLLLICSPSGRRFQVYNSSIMPCQTANRDDKTWSIMCQSENANPYEVGLWAYSTFQVDAGRCDDQCV